MQVVQFTCPHCRTSLRVRSRAFVGREIGCPDCGGRLRILSESGSGYRVELIGGADSSGKQHGPATGTVPKKSAVGGNDLKARLSNGVRRLATPLGLTWVGAGVSLLVLFVVVVGRVGIHSQELGTGARAIEEPLAAGSPSQQEAANRDETDPDGSASNSKKNESGSKELDSQPPAEAIIPKDQRKEVPVSESPREERVEPPAVEVLLPVDAEGPVVAAKPVSHSVPKVIDVRATLAQKIGHYEPKGAQTVRELLREIEELVGVPIRIDDKERAKIEKLLQRSVTVQKQQGTTVGRILEVLMGKVGLVYEVDSDGIRLRLSRVGANGKTF